MKKSCFAAFIIPFILLNGCGKTNTSNSSEPVANRTFSTSQVRIVETTSTYASTSLQVTTLTTTDITLETAETTITEIEITEVISETESVQPVTEQVIIEETSAAETDIIVEETVNYEVYNGILIDEDCSDFETPPEHDLPCMLMYSCRASGYGIDIQQDDGSWKFYIFDEKGQQLSWDYLTNTNRMSELYVTVTGKLENGIIYVEKLE